MPAYHMPTLQAIPETELHEELPPVFKIRFHDLPDNREVPKSVLVPNPFLTAPQTTEAPKFHPLPLDPRPMISPLPRLKQERTVPAIEQRPIDSDRRLTNRNVEQKNPLR